MISKVVCCKWKTIDTEENASLKYLNEKQKEIITCQPGILYTANMFQESDILLR